MPKRFGKPHCFLGAHKTPPILDSTQSMPRNPDHPGQSVLRNFVPGAETLNCGTKRQWSAQKIIFERHSLLRPDFGVLHDRQEYYRASFWASFSCYCPLCPVFGRQILMPQR